MHIIYQLLNFVKKSRKEQSHLLKKSENDNNIKTNKNTNKRNINSTKSQKYFYSANANKYRPFFIKEKTPNKRPKRKYETFIVENSKENESS